MGLKEEVQKCVSGGFKALGNISYVDIAYHKVGDFHYNATTGSNVEFNFLDITLGPTVKTEPHSEDIGDNPINTTDVKLIVPNNSISVVPLVDDYVTIDGDKHNIKWIKGDGVEAAYRIFVREA